MLTRPSLSCPDQILAMSAPYHNSGPPRACVYYAAGNCLFGAACRFRHELDVAGQQLQYDTRSDSRNEKSLQTAHSRPLVYGSYAFNNFGGNDTTNVTCKYWKLGSCMFGSGCRFSHEAVAAAATSTVQQPTVELHKHGVEGSWRARKPSQVNRACTTILREVGECLVTFDAGLRVANVIASFDVTRGRLTGIPKHVEVEDVFDFLASNGIEDTRCTLHKPINGDFVFVSLDTCLRPRLLALPPLDGFALEFVLSKSASDNAAQGSAFGRTLIVQIPLSTPPPLITKLLEHLKKEARRFGFQDITRETPAPGARLDMRIRIRITLDSWDHARDLRAVLGRQGSFTSLIQGVALNDFFLPCKYRYPLFMPTLQYDAQETQWDELSESCKKEGCQLKIRRLSGDALQVTLLGNELSSVGSMKIRAEQLLKGTTVNMWNRRFFENTVVQKITGDIQDATGAFVHFDRRIKCLRLYGSSTAVVKAREQLQLHEEELSKTEYTRELPTQHAIRFFVEHVYPQLTEAYGEGVVRIDLTSIPKKVIVTGGEEVRHRLNKLFDEASADVEATSHINAAQDCPICMCPVTVPTTLDCGHVYCTQCLTHLVKSALDSTSFPLTCSGDEGRCATPIATSILEKFLHATKFRQLLETAFHTYLDQNPDVLSPCRTPGCTQLYARDNSGKEDGSRVVSCPSCFISACASCGRSTHQGTSCEEARRDLSEEYIDSSHDIHRCPNCQTPIFKDGGCNHVSCKCGKHICWRCLEAFDTSKLCYDHMYTRHGGIYDAGTLTETAAPRRRLTTLAFPAIPAAFIEEDVRARAALETRDRADGATRMDRGRIRLAPSLRRGGLMYRGRGRH